MTALPLFQSPLSTPKAPETVSFSPPPPLPPETIWVQPGQTVRFAQERVTMVVPEKAPIQRATL